MKHKLINFLPWTIAILFASIGLYYWQQTDYYKKESKVWLRGYREQWYELHELQYKYDSVCIELKRFQAQDTTITYYDIDTNFGTGPSKNRLIDSVLVKKFGSRLNKIPMYHYKKHKTIVQMEDTLILYGDPWPMDSASRVHRGEKVFTDH